MNFGGDARFFWSENIPDFAQLPSSWDSSLNTGIGKSALSSLWIESFFNLTAFISHMGIPWDIVTLLLWILPAVLTSFLSGVICFRTFFPHLPKYAIISGLIYLLNTYFIMILTGGQLGVSLAYSLSPLVFSLFYKAISTPEVRKSLLASLVLGLQVLFDPRIAAISLCAVILFWIFQPKAITLIRKQFMYGFIIPLAATVLLHTYWILPLIFTRSLSIVPEGFESVSGLEFFSFADFSHALSLLHPNWPENIFGKVYFLQPEFLILPIFAYAALLFIDSKEKAQKFHILFFTFLGLLGTFLVKGTNPPYGAINVLLFEQFPGMSVFRDPTKWYMLIALSYSVLIPLSIHQIFVFISSKLKVGALREQNAKVQFKIQNLSILIFVAFLFFLIRPLWFGELREKLRTREVPEDYVQLKNFLVSQPEFFRTMWIPQWQRFGYFSNTHPAIGRFEILKSASASGQIKELSRNEMQELLRQAAVKYIIVPHDSEGELFLDDRKYDEQEYESTVEELQELEWIREVQLFGEIVVFELPDPKDRFWIDGNGAVTAWQMKSPAHYQVSFKTTQGDAQLIFSEGFDNGWNIKIENQIVASSKFNELLNSFAVEKPGEYTAEVYYEPQKWVLRGLFISLFTLVSLISFFLITKKRK